MKVKAMCAHILANCLAIVCASKNLVMLNLYCVRKVIMIVMRLLLQSKTTLIRFVLLACMMKVIMVPGNAPE